MKGTSAIIFAIITAGFINFSHAGVTPNNPVLDLAKKKSCLACHNIERKMVGPAWKDVAKKGESVEVLVKSIKEGSMGKWGPIPMPPNQVTEEEALSLAVFIKGL